jgi:hypothetical protein
MATFTNLMISMRLHLISSTSIVHKMSVSRLPRRLNLPFQCAMQVSVLHQSSVRNYSITKDWKGSGEHTTERSKKGDTADIHASSSASGLKERQTHEGVADATKSQGTTETGGAKHGKKAKKEHPKAPEPIIGMNDERAKVSLYEFMRNYFGFHVANCGSISQKGE